MSRIYTISLKIFIAIMFYSSLYSQDNFISIEYKNQLNMPTNLTKSIEIDKLGFVWIATDAGLVKFNGQSFEVHKNKLPSQYIKDLVKLNNGDILIISDLGINKIVIDSNAHQIISLIKGGSTRTDSTVFYPKTIFEDSFGNLWISEPDAIVKYKDGKIKRYHFSDTQRADSYFRSFLFVEDDFGHIFVCSQKGSLFFYDKYSDNLKKLFSFKDKSIRIDSFHKTTDGDILIGTNNGIYKISSNLQFNDVKVDRIHKINDVSVIKNYKSNNLIIGTWTNGLYLIKKAGELEKIDKLKFDNISNISVGKTGNIWISSDEGFALINETFFRTVNLKSSSYYIENVSKAIDGNTFVTDGNSIFLLGSETDKLKIKKIFTKAESLILSVAGSEKNLWVSFRDGFIEHRLNGKISRIYLPQTESVNRLVRKTIMDKNSSVWASEEGLKGILKIDNNNKFKLYGKEEGISTYSQTISKDNIGNIYVGGTGSESFLYFYNSRDDKFINQSHLEVPSSYKNIEVNEIVFDSNNNIWLGTNIGLFYRAKNEKYFQKYELNGYPGINIKSLAIDSKDRIWIGFEYGILLLNKGSISRFDINDGLPNLTMSYRSAVVDKNDRLIVGTAHGLAYLQKQIKDENITMSPILTQIVENNKNTLNKNQKLTFENNSYLEFSFITLTYPNDNIQYKWRLLGRDSTWSKPSFNTKIGLAQIESGEYKLQICSQNTGYYWSNPAEIEFVVNKPWYKTYNAIAFYVVFAALLIIALFHYLSLIREKKWVDQKIQSFFALSSDLIVIMDRNGAILYTNSVWLSKLSYLEDDLKGNNYFQFIDKSDHEKVKTEIIYLNTNGGSISLENRMFNKDGSIGYYSWNISISTDKEYLFGIGRDINEMMQMQSELKELNENKDKLFSVISHDLRSPFTSLLGYSKMLIEEFNAFDPEEIKEIIGLSYKSSQKAFDLLEDLFNWAKIQMNKITILIEERNITEIVNEELDLMQSQFLNKNISITKNIDNVISNIDYSSYRIVVKNILSNAFKFCKHNGSIAIKLIEEQNKIIFMVSDNGVGISPEKLLLIQKNKNHHSEYGSDGEKGSALGYELIHKYAECNNGIVELESVLSKGTTVKFTIERI